MDTLQDALFSLSFLALICLVFLIINGDRPWHKNKRILFAGIIMAVSYGCAMFIRTSTKWVPVKKEVVAVRMNMERSFWFKYIALHDRSIPLISRDCELYGELLKDWMVEMDPSVLSSAPSDTVYCYRFQEYKAGMKTGKQKVRVSIAPIPEYEFALFYEQEQRPTKTKLFPKNPQ